MSIRYSSYNFPLPFLFPRLDTGAGIALAALLFLLSLNPIRGENTNHNALTSKASFLFHFTQFITWPPHDSEAGQARRIAIFESESMAKILEQIVKDRRVKEHRIEVVRVMNIDEAQAAEILFIPGEKVKEQKLAIELLKKQPVLLVSEEREFLAMGGMIALMSENEDVRIAINQEALKQAGLKASSRLLRLAQAEGTVE